MSAIAGGLMLASCGADVELDIIHSNQLQRIEGTVELPNGTLAAAGSWWQRVVAALVAPAQALSGNASRVGAGVRVELVRLSSEAAAAGEPGELVDAVTTSDDGSFVIFLPQEANVSNCRFLVEVGDAADDTLTRAFVHGTAGIRIDFRSEAAVRLVLEEVPPADLCAFDNAELAAIGAAIDAAPGDVNADNVADVNDTATDIAGEDAGVQNAITAATAGA